MTANKLDRQIEWLMLYAETPGYLPAMDRQKYSDSAQSLRLLRDVLVAAKDHRRDTQEASSAEDWLISRNLLDDALTKYQEWEDA